MLDQPGTMRMASTGWIVLACMLIMAKVGPGHFDAPDELAGHRLPARADETVVEVLTYNVAGLPELIVGPAPRNNAPTIGRLVSDFDLVLLQEDFCHHAYIESTLTLEHISYAGDHGLELGDGLARLSRCAFGPIERVPWEKAHGVVRYNNDEIATKGFSFARTEMAPGLYVDVYNLHADAGRTAGDVEARRDQFHQLAEHIEKRSRGRAVIVGGDFNIRWNRKEGRAELDELLRRTGLRQAFADLEAAPPVLDGFLYRTGERTELRPLAWSVPSGFVDGTGRALSDHLPIHLRFGVSPPRRP